jgi:ribosome-associated translation inhibitor RaiA
MSIEIRSKDFSITDAMRDHAHRRLGFALDYFAIDRFRKVRRVVVRVGDLNGPKGGMDKFCRILAQVGHGTVVVEDVDSNLYAAISRATHRFALKASRQLKRRCRSAAPAHSSSRTWNARPLTLATEPAIPTPKRMLSTFMGGD